MRYKKPYKCTNWSIVATIERKDGTWYTDTITEIDDDTASSVDTFLNEYIDEKQAEKIASEISAYDYKSNDWSNSAGDFAIEEIEEV